MELLREKNIINLNPLDPNKPKTMLELISKDKPSELKFLKDVTLEEHLIIKFATPFSNVTYALELDNADGVNLWEPVCLTAPKENVPTPLFLTERNVSSNS